MTRSRLITRRQLLRKTGAVSGGLVLAEAALGGVAQSAWALAADAEGQALAKAMPRRVLGKTGRRIPILLQGGSMAWNTKWDPKFPESLRHGIDYFDCAWSYSGGTNEIALGSFLKRTQRRDQLWITSKSNLHDPEGVERRLNESLGRLSTSHVDMYFLHGLDDPRKLDKALLTKVEQLKKQKKLSHFGFSCHHGNVVELLAAAARTPWVDTVMFRYNFRQYGNAELNRAIDACAKAGVGLIAMKTQGSAVSFESEVQKFEQTGRWTKHQAVLKAVWADERLAASAFWRIFSRRCVATLPRLDRSPVTAAITTARRGSRDPSRWRRCSDTSCTTTVTANRPRRGPCTRPCPTLRGAWRGSISPRRLGRAPTASMSRSSSSERRESCADSPRFVGSRPCS